MQSLIPALDTCLWHSIPEMILNSSVVFSKVATNPFLDQRKVITSYTTSILYSVLFCVSLTFAMPGPLSPGSWETVGLRRGGTPVGTIARRMHVRAVLKRHRETRNVARRKSTGRPRKSTARQDRVLMNMVHRDRFRSARSRATSGGTPSIPL